MTSRDEWIDSIVETLSEVPYSESTTEEDQAAAVVLLDWLEPRIRADERAKIVGYLNYEAAEYDKLERASGRLANQSAAGVLHSIAQNIENGEPTS